MWTGMSVRRRLPLALKVVYTLFVAVLVPYYWVTYTPWNFLFACDLALLITLAALWLENPLLAGVAAVGITVPQALWVLDFVTLGRLLGMAGYMYDPKIPLFVRGLSLFHGWLPFLLLWLVARLGYDRRAYPAQVVLGSAVLLVCFLLGPPPPAPASNPNAAVNINYVYGPSFERPQTWVAPGVWFAGLILGVPLLIVTPTHLLFRAVYPQPRQNLAQ
ncbi:MAG: hypothetical protein U0835_26055 [Isosphaeraceae bacterium]